jgi:ribosomal protein S18 acetylase RimI-like enzyme
VEDEMIREGRAEDQPIIMDLIQAAIIDMEAKGIYQWDSIYPDQKVITDDIKDRTLYVYADGGIVQGIIVLNEHQDDAYHDLIWRFNTGRQLVVHRLCIAPQYQGKGIARLLMEFAEQLSKDSGYESIRLDAFAENARACDLYKKIGYKEVGIVDFRKGKFYCFEKKVQL